MTSPIRHNILFICCCLCSAHGNGQLADSSIKKIDAVFSRWTQAGSPGAAVGIIKGKELIFSKGYGLANLEYQVPITAQTIFHIASVSKQFTAYSILLLQDAGKLNIKDDIRKYLPWFPDQGVKINIRQLLEHTSGIRDQFSLLALGGTQLDDVLTQDHLVKILGRQRSLDFCPGTRFNYSNSGYTLAAEIVKVVSGQSFRQFTDSAIFKPLGMLHTYFRDDYTEIIPSRAYSYSRKDSNSFANSTLSYAIVGGTGLLTNIEDMSKWVQNFFSPRVGNKETIKLLTTAGLLGNGEKVPYALGLGSDIYKGQLLWAHSGSDAGYRSVMVVYPALELGFVVFCNLADMNPAREALQLANLFLPPDTPLVTTAASALPPTDEHKFIHQDHRSWSHYTGDYIGDNGVQCSFELEGELLFWRSFGEKMALKQTGRFQFQVIEKPQTSFIFNMPFKGDTIIRKFTKGEERVFQKVRLQNSYSEAFLKSITGVYYSEELDTRYTIILRNGKLVMQHNRYADMPLQLVGTEHLLNDEWFIGHLQLIRNEKKVITGFGITNNRVRNIRFKKIH